ncbi:hypothetical protein FEM33_07085 [Dyadobacter flavalbus]|uniref:DUF4974 domain-containing protein n=1 Tax=Dyadobacter flavalbus TaxID=2579942 RepID=A0A5M8R2G3_9BACT|nr:hypothetical protein [Dyadobacter flavalbus]KAA6440362.1 hypothetical protein FEM33_07085 [Dyadobacter flavalbus]
MGVNKTCFLLLLIIIITVLNHQGYSQRKTNRNLSLRLQLKGKISLDSLTRYVHLHTRIRFSYNSEKVSNNLIITLPRKQYSLAELLKHITKTTSLTYHILHEYVIFQSKPDLKNHLISGINHTDKKSEKNSNQKLTGKFQQYNHVKGRKLKSLKFAQVNPNTDEKLVNVRQHKETDFDIWTSRIYEMKRIAKYSEKPVKGINYTLRGSQSIGKLNSTIQMTDKFSKPASVFKWHINAGMYASELSYANIAYEVGFKPIHLFSSVGTNFKIANWRIGLGAVLKDKVKSQYQISATVGFLRQKESFGSGQSKENTLVNGILYTGAMSWNKKLTSKCILKIGPTFNILKTRYFINDKPALVRNFPFGTKWYESELSLIDPPFLLQNTYSIDKSSCVKKWIGLSMGFYYCFL